MLRVSSSKELASKILDFSSIYVHRLGRRDKVEKDFIEKVQNLKDHNGLIAHLTKKYF
jgi:hypothetical protein